MHYVKSASGASSGINDTLITLRNSGLENAKKSCNGRDDCCTAEEPCERGEGDCDPDNDHEQCHGNLKCGVDNCKKGAPFDTTDDCCEGKSLYLSSLSRNSRTGWIVVYFTILDNFVFWGGSKKMSSK